MSGNTRCLHQFRYSHFNEKARWALAYKGLDVPRKNYLPGPHAGQITELSGQGQTPVLQWGERVVPGSAAIIDFLEREIPTPALYPADETLKAEALAIQSRFDEEVGPAVRRALFFETMNDSAYMARLFAGDRAWLVRASYAAMLPLVRPIMRKSMDISEAAQAEALATTEKALDYVAETSKETGYLAGDAFSVADLTAAALLAITANPSHVDMKRPEPKPASVNAWLARWEGHAGVSWVRRMYDLHRG